MTVVDVLPGGGWYTKILLPYLGELARSSARTMRWMCGWESGTTAKNSLGKGKPGSRTGRPEQNPGVTMTAPTRPHSSSVPYRNPCTVPPMQFLFVRALHNMAYVTPDARHLAAAIQDAYDVLKPGGIVGVVQHHARVNMPDKWADGEMGYLKKAYVIEMMEAAGLELVDESAVNANSNDMPTTEQYVWRLPPGYDGADTPETKAKVDAIGESNRMTLKFRKP